MFMSNLEEYGHLVNPDDYSTERLHNDLYEIDSNRFVSEWYNFYYNDKKLKI